MARRCLDQYPGREGLELLYLPEFLLTKLPKLRELQPSLPPMRVGWFEGCHMRNAAFAPGVEIKWKPTRKLLEVIKGVEIHDLPSWKCCIQHHEEIIDEALEEKLACIVTPCAVCWTEIERHAVHRGMPVWMIQDILVTALGEKVFEGFFFPLWNPAGLLEVGSR